MATDTPPKPPQLKWWKPVRYPRFDMFTLAAMNVILAVLIGIGAAPIYRTWRLIAVISLLVSALFGAWRASRMPPDEPACQ